MAGRPALGADQGPTVRCAMIKEGTPAKYLLRAAEPGSRRPLTERHATRDAVSARRAALERAGYYVLVTLADQTTKDEFLQPEGRRSVRDAFRLSATTLRQASSPRGFGRRAATPRLNDHNGAAATWGRPDAGLDNAKTEKWPPSHCRCTRIGIFYTLWKAGLVVAKLRE
jgi:hypothetical protein